VRHEQLTATGTRVPLVIKKAVTAIRLGLIWKMVLEKLELEMKDVMSIQMRRKLREFCKVRVDQEILYLMLLPFFP
jgi:hypothetical protein